MLAFASGTTLEAGSTATLSGAGTIRVGGATVNFAGSAAITGTLEITTGVLNFNGTGTTANMTHSGGTLGGTGNLTVSRHAQLDRRHPDRRRHDHDRRHRHRHDRLRHHAGGADRRPHTAKQRHR